MYKYHCLNPISAVGLDQLDENYVNVETAKGADAILVRSAKMHEMEFDKNLKVIARAGAVTVCLADHIFYDNVKDFSHRVAVL